MRLSLPYAPETPDFVETPQGRIPVPERMTAAEFVEFPFAEKDHWELIEGTPVMSPAPSPAHQRLQGILFAFLDELLSNRDDVVALQDVDLRLQGSSDWFRPDVCVALVRGLNFEGRPIDTVPRLVVEILSPSTGGRDIGIKREIYARSGVPEYWVADPATGALSVFTDPATGEYRQQHADEDGYVNSPFVGKALRIQRSGHRYRVLAR